MESGMDAWRGVEREKVVRGMWCGVERENVVRGVLFREHGM